MKNHVVSLKHGLIAVAIGVGVAGIVTACTPPTSIHSVNCSDGKCVTSSFGTGAPASSSNPPKSLPTPPAATTPPAQPTATVTATITAPAPTVTPTVTVTPTTDASIQSCLPSPSEQTLAQLANDATYDLSIATCLQVSNPQAFAQQLQQSAVIAYETGQGNTQAGVQVWVASSGTVRCPDGQDVSSVTALYHSAQSS